jgi:hypothetical protein
MFLSAVCVKYCPVDATIPCKNNSLFSKKGTCGNYLHLKSASSYTAPYVSYDIFGMCIPKTACQAKASINGAPVPSTSPQVGCLDVAS